MAAGGCMALQNRVQGIATHVRHVEGTHLALTLHQRKNWAHMTCATTNLGIRLATDIREVSFNGLAFTADRCGWVSSRAFHDFPDAMHQEPCGLHAAVEGALNLPSADSFLTRGDELDSLQPEMQREMTVLENAADPHGEGLTARVTLSQAGTASLAGQAADSFVVAVAAVRARRPAGPQMRFDVGKSGFLVVEVRGRKDRMSHGNLLWTQPYT